MRNPVLALLTLLYFGPLVFLGPLLCTSRALGAEGEADLTRVAPVDEPGELLEVRGTLYAADGSTPVVGAEIYVYHTDQNGLYSAHGSRSDDPRLKATLWTDPLGRYAFRTIRPGPYPAAAIPAHIHFVVRTESGEQRRELRFAGDPLLSGQDLSRSRAAGRFGMVRPVELDGDGVWQVTFDLRLDG